MQRVSAVYSALMVLMCCLCTVWWPDYLSQLSDMLLKPGVMPPGVVICVVFLVIGQKCGSFIVCGGYFRLMTSSMVLIMVFSESGSLMFIVIASLMGSGVKLMYSRQLSMR